MNTYDVFHLPVLSWMNILYFFFGGLAAGSFLLSFWAGYEREKLRSLAKTSAVVTPILLVVSMALLILDLGRPFRFWLILTTLQPTSIVSWASWVLMLFFIVATLYAFLWFTDKGDSAKTLGWLGLPLAIFVGMYTGLLLMQMAGNPLWESALLPWMFLVGALLSAMAMNVLIMTVTGHKPSESFFGLKKYICTLVIVELLMVGSEFEALYMGPAKTVEVANLLTGEFSTWFIGLQIIVGSLLPLGLLVTIKASKNVAFHTLVSTLLLVGVLAMRYIVVMGGQVNL